MRTFEFKTYQDRPFSKMKFLPSVTFEAEEFGRHFFLDANFEFIFSENGYIREEV